MVKSFNFFLVIFLTSIFVGAADRPPTPPAPSPAPPATESVLSQILAVLGQPSFRGVKFSINLSDKPLRLLDIQGVIDFALEDNFNFQFQTATPNSTTTDFIPTVSANTQGYVIHIVVTKGTKTDPTAIVSSIAFQKDLVTTPLEVKLKSKKVSYLSIRISSVDFIAKGLNDKTGKIVVTGTCKIEQSLLDLKTHKVKYKTAGCTVNGSYDRSTGKPDVTLDYDGPQ